MNKLNKEWKDLNNNFILEEKDFYISYNPDTEKARTKELTDLANTIGTFINEKFIDGEETALVDNKEKTKIFYILQGDFRKEYEDLLPKGFKACLDFYNSKPELHSSWST